jgi:hypothetical protein
MKGIAVWAAVAGALFLAAMPAARAAEHDSRTVAYVVDGGEGAVARFAPVFLIEHDEVPHNKIGTPSARLDESGKEVVFVDPSHPTVYTEVATFDTERGHYTNLIYRIHFEENPFTLVPLNVGAGKNVGAIAVITLNANSEPVWLTTVQSCGCYHAIIPTDYLAKDAYPDGWDTAGLTVYGEQLPGLLPMREASPDARLAITIRGDSHRCMGVDVRPLSAVEAEYPLVQAATAPVATLKSLPLPDGGKTSFFHTRGHRKGLVKGAYKPLETLLFGLWAWDHNVGQDREYGAKEAVGRRFYTTLFFARKKDADMWHYAQYLEHNGWKP